MATGYDKLPFSQLIQLFAAAHGMTWELILDRMVDLHWDYLVAMVVPPNVDVSIMFISVNNVSYYSVPWSDKPEIARNIIARYNDTLLQVYDSENPKGKYMPLGWEPTVSS